MQLREAVGDALASGAKKLLIDLKEVRQMDSSGIGEMLAAHASAARLGCQIKLSGLSSRVATVLQVTRLMGVLDTHENVDEALLAFAD